MRHLRNFWRVSLYLGLSNLATFVSVSGTTGDAFFINIDHVRSIRPSKQPSMSRLLMDAGDGTETAISVNGTPQQVAKLFNTAHKAG